MNPAIGKSGITERPGGAESLLAGEAPSLGIAFAWLGQAGFLYRSASATFLVDPYLSDSLAEKYRGREFPHRRMMEIPLAPDALRGVDAVLCTHRHTDHLDPGTLPAVAEGNPSCLFVVPAAVAHAAEAMGLPADRTVPVNDGSRVEFRDSVEVTALPSAHETLETNESGEHLYLGYVVRCGGITLYHSGDCVPYPGLRERLADRRIDAAFLPVNGRDAYRRDRGVPGNMDVDEALDVCRDAAIPLMVAHHFGMFEFNTVPPEELHRRIRRHAGKVACIVPSLERHWTLTPA